MGMVNGKAGLVLKAHQDVDLFSDPINQALRCRSVATFR
jgi:hypothetical protein